MNKTQELRKQLNDMINNGSKETVLSEPAVVKRALELEQLIELQVMNNR